jgi:DNA repair exonuclease SbcCD nuclease subunit
MIYITGDKHIPIDMPPLEKFLDNNKLNKEDFLIICGDVGFLWNYTMVYEYWLQWFANQEFITLYVDGNHENHARLDALPVTLWNGGKVHKLADNVIHLMRGQIFTIDEKKFFTFGGADSIDRNRRIPNVTWWEREMPSNQEYEEGLQNLQKNNFEVDYIVTHTCSIQLLQQFYQKYRMQPYVSAINQYFNMIEQMVRFSKWYCGHFHFDENIDDKHTVLYDNVQLIGENNE